MLRILTLTLTVLLCTLVVHGRTFVVCAGISDYPGTANDLHVCDDDARTLHRIFQTNGASCTTIVNSDVTVQRLLSALQASFLQASPKDVIVFFFSGHGYPGGLCLYDKHLAYENIFDVMRKSHAGSKIIITDACFAGKMRKNESRPQMTSPRNIMLFLSSRSAEKSIEGPNRNSLFTLHLERALRGGADSNRDRVITASELFSYVHQRVVKSSGGRQHPVMWGRFNRNMAVIRWNEK